MHSNSDTNNNDQVGRDFRQSAVGVVLIVHVVDIVELKQLIDARQSELMHLQTQLDDLSEYKVDSTGLSCSPLMLLITSFMWAWIRKRKRQSIRFLIFLFDFHFVIYTINFEYDIN